MDPHDIGAILHGVGYLNKQVRHTTSTKSEFHQTWFVSSAEGVLANSQNHNFHLCSSNPASSTFFAAPALDYYFATIYDECCDKFTSIRLLFIMLSAISMIQANPAVCYTSALKRIRLSVAWKMQVHDIQVHTFHSSSKCL